MSPAAISLIIFGICVVLFLWNKIPIALTALLGLFAMIMFNVCTFKEGFEAFSGYIIVLICSMMVVGQAAFDTGLAGVVGNAVVGLARGNERLVVILSTAITAIISAFLSNIASLAIMIAILTSLCASNNKVHFKNVILPVSMAAVIGGSVTLVGSTPQLTAQGILEKTLGEGNAFSFFTFTIPGIIIIAVLVLFAGFVGYPLGKKLWGNREDYNKPPVTEDAKELPTPKKSKMIVMAVIFCLTIAMFILSDTIKTVIPQFNLGMASLAAALLCVVTGCIEHKKAIKSINWNLGVWFCACLGIAKGLDVSGGGKLIAEWFIGLFGENVSPFVLFAAFVFLTVVLTQFLSNSTVIAIILPIAISLTTEMGFNSYSFAIGITMGGAMAVATPLANTTIGMAMVADYKFSDFFKYAGPVTAAALAVILAVVPILYPLV